MNDWRIYFFIFSVNFYELFYFMRRSAAARYNMIAFPNEADRANAVILYATLTVISSHGPTLLAYLQKQNSVFVNINEVLALDMNTFVTYNNQLGAFNNILTAFMQGQQLPPRPNAVIEQLYNTTIRQYFAAPVAVPRVNIREEFLRGYYGNNIPDRILYGPKKTYREPARSTRRSRSRDNSVNDMVNSYIIRKVFKF